MKTQLKRNGAILALVMASSALAYGHDRCIGETKIFLGAKTLSVGSCKAGKPLQLVTVTANFPRLSNNPRQVSVWEGSFEKEIQEEVTTLHEVYNRCTGETRVSERKTQVETRDLEFAIENPNLSRDISRSYDLVPMTDEEAKQALAKAKRNCENYSK